MGEGADLNGAPPKIYECANKFSSALFAEGPFVGDGTKPPPPVIHNPFLQTVVDVLDQKLHSNGGSL